MANHTGKANRRGQTIVEFALMLPVFLVMLYGIIEFARFMQAYLTVQHAAREGARYAITGRSITGDPADRPQSIVEMTRRAAAGLLITPSADTPAYEANPSVPGLLDVWLVPQDAVDPANRPSPFVPEPITVTVTYNYEPIVPVVFNVAGQRITIIPPVLTVVGRATMIVERIDKVTPVAEGTLGPSATPGPTSTPGPTNTPGPTPTASNTPTVTPTPSITPTPSNTPPPSATPPCNISAGAINVHNDKITLSINNQMGVDAVISSIYVNWPAANAKLKEIKLDGTKISRPNDTSPPTSVSTGWLGSTADRTIGAGNSGNLEIKFEHKPIESSPYLVMVTFDNGCSVSQSLGSVSTPTATPTTGPSPTPTITPTPTQTPTATPTPQCDITAGSLSLDGKKVDLPLQNNMADTQTISSITVVWPSSAKEFKKVKLNGVTIWDKKSKTSPTTISSGWSGSANDRSLAGNGSGTLRFEFKENLGSLGGFAVSITFTSGCVVTAP